MADKHFSDWTSLVQAVNKKSVEILKKDVSPVAEEILKERIKDDIYDAYTPIEGGYFAGKFYTNAYKRRHVLENKIKSYMINKDTLLVTSTATASKPLVSGWSFHYKYDGAFLEMLEVGDMGIWKKGFPRPAVKNTERQFESDKRISSAIKKGIKREIGIYTET